MLIVINYFVKDHFESHGVKSQETKEPILPSLDSNQ